MASKPVTNTGAGTTACLAVLAEKRETFLICPQGCGTYVRRCEDGKLVTPAFGYTHNCKASLVEALITAMTEKAPKVFFTTEDT